MKTHKPSDLTPDQRWMLLQAASSSIQHGIHHGQSLSLDAENYPRQLQIPTAVFVTLRIKEELRGCMGTLEAEAPLILAVAKQAYNAAFYDPRFSVVTAMEFDQLDIHLSLLNPPEPMEFQSEEDLLSQIRPGADGLILDAGLCHGTLIPSAWKVIKDRKEFLRILKQKAGLRADYWSDSIKVRRYSALSIP